MAKKKPGRHVPANKTERVVNEEFEFARSVTKKALGKGNAAREVDLAGPVLKRRIAATLTYMDQVKKRYARLYPSLDMEREWAKQNCAMVTTVSQVDEWYHLSLAAAIWMLDALKQSGKLGRAFRYLTKDRDALDTIDMPKLTDPCFDDAMIRGMLHLIRERDDREKPEQWYINETTAKRKKQSVLHTPTDTDEACMDARARFDAVFAMINPTLKERAVQRFEERLWAFLDQFFLCASDCETEMKDYQTKLDRVMEQCDEHFFSGRWQETEVDSKLFGRMLEQRDELREKVQELSMKHTKLLLNAPVAPSQGRSQLESMFDQEIAERMLGFEVDDPYEICFAYLCLIEKGSDLPWLYNASIAVLMAAAQKLPWTVMQEDDSESEWDEDSPDETTEISSEWAEQDNVLFEDWNFKKAGLYQKSYSDRLLYFPEDVSDAGQQINLPQLVYNLTGTLMPRTVSFYDGIASELVSSGMEPGLAIGMELYFQLASEVKRRDVYQQAHAQTEAFQEMFEMFGDKQEADAPTGDLDVHELRDALKAAKAENDRLKQERYAFEKEAKDARAEAERTAADMANEHQELLDLRELVYHQANDQVEGAEDVTSADGILPYTVRKKTVIYGGHDTWMKVIKTLLSDVVFVARGQNINQDMIRTADVIWIQPNALSHASFYKIINTARAHHVQVRYFAYASARKCALQLAEEEQKA